MSQSSAVQLDHIILGINDLERGVAEFETRTGVRPEFGGAHPGRGTHNALASLGNDAYIEILAPNPDDTKADVWIKGLEGLTTLTPVGWALAAADLEVMRTRAESGGVTLTQAMPGSRMLPGGSKLEWMTMGVSAPPHDWAPFFIQWRDPALQPSRTAPSGCSLASVAIADPRPEAIRTLLSAVGFDMTVTEGGAAAMTVTLTCPKGTVTF